MHLRKTHKTCKIRNKLPCEPCFPSRRGEIGSIVCLHNLSSHFRFWEHFLFQFFSPKINNFVKDARNHYEALFPPTEGVRLGQTTSNSCSRSQFVFRDLWVLFVWKFCFPKFKNSRGTCQTIIGAYLTQYKIIQHGRCREYKIYSLHNSAISISLLLWRGHRSSQIWRVDPQEGRKWTIFWCILISNCSLRH